MEVPVEAVARAARGWAAQREDLRAAADQLATAPTSGFTPAVAAAADRFTAAWRGHAADLASGAQARGTAVRGALAVVLYADAEAAIAHTRLTERLAERLAGRRGERR